MNLYFGNFGNAGFQYFFAKRETINIKNIFVHEIVPRQF